MNDSHPSCCPTHQHAHPHDHHTEGLHHTDQKSSLIGRWILSLLLITSAFILLKDFFINQMLVRVVSYSSYAYSGDVERICRKVLIFDHDNKEAWTALGFMYMDQGHLDKAIEAFDKASLHFQYWQAPIFELGHLYFLKKDYKKAIGYFERVRQMGPQASQLLDVAMLKYRHGTSGFQSVHSMGRLLAMLSECYKQTGHQPQAIEIQKEFDMYQSKHKNILF